MEYKTIVLPTELQDHGRLTVKECIPSLHCDRTIPPTFTVLVILCEGMPNLLTSFGCYPTTGLGRGNRTHKKLILSQSRLPVTPVQVIKLSLS